MFKKLINTRNYRKECAHIFTATIFLAFHYYFTVYINSTFLLTIVDRFWVGILYSLSSFFTIILLLKLSKIISKIGLYKVILSITLMDILSLFILSFSEIPVLIILGFILYQSIPPLLLACFDTAIEDSTPIFDMGKARGIFLTILAIASVVSPLLVGGLVADNGFKEVYLLSLFFSALFLLTVWVNRSKFKNGKFTGINGIDSIKEFISNPDIKRIGIANFALHLFFSWMIIYLPVYLVTEMGFTWAEVGMMISITLLPFVIIEIPAGELADKVLGEKEMLIGGIICMIIATLIFPMIGFNNFIGWTLIILFARIGAALAETMIESYFFKKSQDKDELIEVFRMASPSAFIFGPIIGSISLIFIPFNYIFPILSVILLITLLFIFRLNDTK